MKHYRLFPEKIGIWYLYFVYVLTRFPFYVMSIFLAMGKVAKQQISFIALSTSSLREVLITTEIVDYVRCKY